jgi:hypothetical protein
MRKQHTDIRCTIFLKNQLSDFEDFATNSIEFLIFFAISSRRKSLASVPNGFTISSAIISRLAGT